MYEAPDGRYYSSKRDYDFVRQSSIVVEEGWGMIEGFSNYAVSPQGEIVNLHTMRLMSIRSTGGTPHQAPQAALVSDSGKQTTVSVARAVAMTYLPLPPDFDEMYYDVGYHDGNNKNYHLDNLFWKARWRNHTTHR